MTAAPAERRLDAGNCCRSGVACQPVIQPGAHRCRDPALPQGSRYHLAGSGMVLRVFNRWVIPAAPGRICKQVEASSRNNSLIVRFSPTDDYDPPRNAGAQNTTRLPSQYTVATPD